MTRRSSGWRRAAVLSCLLLAVTACAPTDGGGAPAGTPTIPVGPGVTPNTITLGILTDLTGPGAAEGQNVTRGNQLFWQDQNDRDGVCGRSVVLIIKNHAGDRQSATALYDSLQSHVLGLQQMLGEPILTALRDRIESDGLLTVAVSRSSKLLADPYVVVTGTTYDVEWIDGVDWLMRNRGLIAGDRIGEIHVGDGYGEDAFLGIAAAAKADGLTLVSEQAQPDESDMSAQMRAIRTSGARVVLLSTTPAQAASAMSSAEATGFDPVFMALAPTFAPSLLEGPARAVASTRLFIVQPYTPYAGESPGAGLFRREYGAAYPHEVPNAAADYGYGQAEVMYQLLKASCARGSLERAALARSMRTIHDLDSQGLLVPLDYSAPGQPPGRAVYVLQPDPAVSGDLRVVQFMTGTPLALTYRCPC